MGASDSKLVFKKSIFWLSGNPPISLDDSFWTAFWKLPENAEDIFTLFSASDIRRTRDGSLENLETLILAVTSRLFALRDHPSFPHPEAAPERDALNCIRILTRLLPFLYEADNLTEWEDGFFWRSRGKTVRNSNPAEAEVLFDGSKPDERLSPRTSEDGPEDSRPLAEELIDTLIDLLFYSDFTLPRSQDGRRKVTYSIWQSGVGCHTSIATSKEFESNRCEVLRLLLTIASKSMYMHANVLPVKGLKALTYMVTCPDKQIVLSVLCSLMNTTLKYNPASWRVPYDHVVFKDSKQVLVIYCLQLLLVLVLYPLPEESNGQNTRNYYRHFLGRLHRPQDFQFLVDGMTRVLNQPVQANSSYLPGSQKSIRWAPEMILFFWEMLQCNKHFRSFIVDTERAHDFLVLILFYALDQKTDPSKHGVVRMCIFVLQTLSAEPKFAKSLNKHFEGQSSLPASVRVEGFHGSYADYLIVSIHTLITTSKGKLQAIYPAMLAIISNFAAYVRNLSMTASAKIMQLFISMSSPSFLLANETNHTLLYTLLDAMNAIIEHQYSANPNFILVVLRARKKFEDLRNFTLESAQVEIERRHRRKEGRTPSVDSSRSPTNPQRRVQSLPEVPEGSSAFAIGEDDETDDDDKATPAQSRSPRSPPESTASDVSAPVNDALPVQLRGMSEKARGKLPAGTMAFSRQNSTTSLSHSTASTAGQSSNFVASAEWVESWLPSLPLHTILTLIQELGPQLPSTSSSHHRPSETSSPIADLEVIRHAEIRGIDPSPIRVHLFEWSRLSLAWYESLLWGFIFAGELYLSKGTSGIWNGTVIKLFRVQETASAGPSLLAPRGAVDAVGSNLVQRINSLNLRGGAPAAAAATGATGAGAGGPQPPPTAASSTRAEDLSQGEGGGGGGGGENGAGRGTVV